MPSPLRKTSTPGVYRRGGRYVVIVRDRERRQHKRAAATLAEARALKAELTADLQTGRLASAPRTRFKDYAETWIGSYRGRTSRGVRPHVMADYARIVRRYAVPFFGATPLGDIHLRDIKRYAEHLAERGCSQSTVRGYVLPLRLVLATAVEDGLIAHNPATGFRNVYGRRSEPQRKAMTEAELAAVLAELPPRYRLLGRFMAETGLRISEVAALDWNAVDELAHTVHVTRRYFNRGFDAPKTANGVRTVPFSDSLCVQLRELRIETRGRRGDLVFPTEAGTPLDSHTLRSRIFKPAAERAGVPWVALHSFRHTCASRLFRSGWNAKQVQVVLGHHSPAFTMATYIHLMPDDLPALPAAPAIVREDDDGYRAKLARQRIAERPGRHLRLVSG